MQSRTMLLICDSPSFFSNRILDLAARYNFSIIVMTSDQLASSITIIEEQGSLSVEPALPSILLSTTSTNPNSFDEEFINQEKETTIRSWAILNPHKTMRCVNVRNNDPSAFKTSCSVLEREFGLPSRREIFSSSQRLNKRLNQNIWMRDCFSQVMACTQTEQTPSLTEGPFWGREALSSGTCTTFLCVDQWCKKIQGEDFQGSLSSFTKAISSRLDISIGFFVWWRNKDTLKDHLARIERFPPDYLPVDVLNQAIHKIFEVLAQ